MVNNEHLKKASYLELQILGDSFPPFGGNISVFSDPGGYFCFGEIEMEEKTFGERAVEIFTKKYEIPNILSAAGLKISKKIFERLKLDKDLLKFVSDSHGKLLFWNIENSILTKSYEKEENPRFEVQFGNCNPYALVALVANAIRKECPIQRYTQCGLDKIEAIPEIAKYLNENAQSKYR